MSDVTKKSEYILEVPIGELAKVNVYVDPSPQGNFRLVQRAIKKPHRPSLADEFIPQQEFAFTKGSKRWMFFDLGTRLRVVPTATSTWADMVIELNASGNKIEGYIPEDQVLEYAELNYVALGHFTDRLYQPGVPPSSENMYEVLNLCNVQVAPDNWADILAFNNYTLGIHDDTAIDPLGFSSYDPNLHEKTRRIPHCLPLWYGPPNQQVDENYVSTDGTTNMYGFDIVLTDVATEQVTVYPNAEYRETQANHGRMLWKTGDYAAFADLWDSFERHENPYWATADENDETGKVVYTMQDYENWNPFNLDEMGLDKSNYAVMNLKDDITATGEPPLTGACTLALHSRFAYESFDTTDTDNFKVTLEPDYNADPAGPIFVTPATNLMCYLVPKMYGYAIHLFMYSACAIEYETYRQFSSGYNRYQNNVLVGNNGTGTPAGSTNGGVTFSGFPVMGLAGGFDPDMIVDAVQTLTVSDSDGAYEASGPVESSGTATLIGGSIYSISIDTGDFVMSASWFKETVPANYATSTVTWTVNMNYVYQTATSPIASPQVLRGLHVGRFPAIPAGDVSSSIYSSLTWEGPLYKTGANTWERTDGTNADYDPDIAKDLDGLGMLWYPGLSEVTGSDIHIRNRDPNTILHTDRIFVQFSATQSSFIPQTQSESAYVLTHDPVSPDTEAAVGSMEAIVEAEAQRIASEYLAVLSTRTHNRNVNQISGPDATVVGNQWGSNLYPIDGKAGQLVAVVVTNGTKQYVWRTADEDRGGLDVNGRPLVLLDLFFDEPIPPYV